MINILFCGNVKVFDGILTSSLSILKRTKEPVTFHIFTMDVSRIKDIYTPITKKQVKFLNEIVKKYNNQNEVKLYDVTDIYED